MANITPTVLNSIFTALNAYFLKGLGRAPDVFGKYASTVPSSASAEEYPVALVFGAMRELTGDPVIDRTKLEKLKVRNRTFNRMQAVSREAIADDSIAAYQAIFEEMGYSSEALWGQLAADALMSPGKWIDDLPFFSSTRKIAGKTINNLIAGALTADNWNKAVELMQSYTAQDGVTALGLVPNVLIVGPKNKQAAKKILEANFSVENNATVDNLNKGDAEIVVDPYLVGDHALNWFAACTNRGLQPVIVQQRDKGALQRVDSPESEPVVRRNENQYYVRSRGNSTLTLPQLIIKGTGA